MHVGREACTGAADQAPLSSAIALVFSNHGPTLFCDGVRQRW